MACLVLIDGEGITLKANVKFRLACCDCGLVHDMAIATRGKSDIGFAVQRNKRATTARRKWMAKNFIAGAIKKPGQLHKDLGVPQGKKIPAGKMAAAAKMPGKVGQRARFAETLKGFKK